MRDITRTRGQCGVGTALLENPSWCRVCRPCQGQPGVGPSPLQGRGCLGHWQKSGMREEKNPPAPMDLAPYPHPTGSGESRPGFSQQSGDIIPTGPLQTSGYPGAQALACARNHPTTLPPKINQLGPSIQGQARRRLWDMHW